MESKVEADYRVGTCDHNVGRRQKRRSERQTELSDIPSPILSLIVSMTRDVRSRNSISLVCIEWYHMERQTRRELKLRGNIGNFHLLPSSFQAVSTLDLSNCSPWGYSIFQSIPAAGELSGQWLKRAFPCVKEMTVYVRDAVDIQMVGWLWPNITSLSLVRWHQRSMQPEVAAEAGMELSYLFQNCFSLQNLDLSRFYCWTEDIPPALLSGSVTSTNLVSLNLLKISPEGFKGLEICVISMACRNLRELYVLCEFDPRFVDSVNDYTLTHIATNCNNLVVLQMFDTTQFGAKRTSGERTNIDANITCHGIEVLLKTLVKLEDIALVLGQRVMDCGRIFEKFFGRLQKIKLSHFDDLCSNSDHLNGLSMCTRLTELSIKCWGDLSDEKLEMISRGCIQLVKLSLLGCKNITEYGLSKCLLYLRLTLLEVEVECCDKLTTAAVLRSLSPLRSSIEKLHLDCIWNEVEDNDKDSECWSKLKYLSLWIGAAELIWPLANMGLNNCPVLEKVSIRVEGDCRVIKPKSKEWGLAWFGRFEKLNSLVIDLSEAVGYALSAPGGNKDVSIWERFYLTGIHALKNLIELEYYPPSDRDLNQRGMTLPGVGLISQCSTMRKLFVHGTTYEHLMMMLLRIPNLRDVQLREDYYPAPETEMSEMRSESCRRFESILAKRGFPD